MKTTIHKADSRGLADHGWLLSRHSFSFADYYDRERMNFGLLRVINDDIVKPAMGFGTHPHENMEIVSIPLKGTLRHQDSMGNRHIISAGEVQIMSAGSGLTHSEYNDSDTEDVNFLQIWVFPEQKNIEPRYGQKRFDPAARRNHFQLLVSPDGAEKSIVINQQTWFSMIQIAAGATVSYPLHDPAHGLYLFIIEGEAVAAGTTLGQRDGLGISEAARVEISTDKGAEVLAIEVPIGYE